MVAVVRVSRSGAAATDAVTVVNASVVVETASDRPSSRFEYRPVAGDGNGVAAPVTSTLPSVSRLMPAGSSVPL
ncbi:MAG: hypothetical protein D6761_06515 [Candidatus Dadabacteria bacterium]|nr:MAG: hypothetical protein D6761_06515 [Candidatus Dadabacteria bacterium]